MAFKLIKNPTIVAPVDLMVPGQQELARIEVEYAYRLPESLRNVIAGEVVSATLFGRLWRRVTSLWRRLRNRKPPMKRDVLVDLIVSWNGVNDADDVPLAYTPAMLDALLRDYPGSADALLFAYLKARAEGHSKN